MAMNRLIFALGIIISIGLEMYFGILSLQNFDMLIWALPCCAMSAVTGMLLINEYSTKKEKEKCQENRH